MIKFLARGANFLLGKPLQNSKLCLASTLEFLERKRTIDTNYFDYIRLGTLELVSAEINRKNIQGSVAELGVYKGKFARYINEYFKERTLYLFDTFKGFDDRDIRREKTENFSTGSQDFSQTSIASVLKQMPFPDKCVPVKGFFPDTTRGIEDRFAFVSIDTDLYEPVYAGLQFFYPRLEKGGYIFIHDFNNDHYKGSRKAVEQYCGDQNINFVPIPDSGGSAIITK